MPFVEDAGPVGSGLGPAHLIVEPGKVLQLKRRFEARRDKIEQFLYAGRIGLRVTPPGTDPCSEATAEELSRNGDTAVTVTKEYVARLSQVIEQLDQIAKAYGLAEESNAGKFQGECR